MSKKQIQKKRDYNILAHQKGEINIATKTVKDKTKYTRKEKHKKDYHE